MIKESLTMAKKVRMICDSCGIGEMEFIDHCVYTTYPITYGHKCTKCGREERYECKFPYLEFITQEEITNYVYKNLQSNDY